jgi:hypothetical protein
MTNERAPRPPKKRTLWIATAAVKLGVAAVVACSSGSPASPKAPAASSVADAGAPPATLTYYKDVKPILDAKCTMCHYSGGIAPFELTSYADAQLHAPDIGPAVSQHIMPPWPPGPSCNSYQGDRSLTDAEVTTLVSWTGGALLEGDPSTYAALPGAPPPTLSRVDDQLQMTEAYTPQERPDDYRCFLIPWPETTLKYVTGFGAKPGQTSIVHHLLTYVVPPGQIPTYQAYDDADPGPGYTCFGGPTGNLSSNGTGAGVAVPADAGASMLAALPEQIGGWVPGSLGSDFPAGTGIQVQPGSMVVLQVHYNTLNAPPAPDQTSLQVEVADSVQKQAYIIPFTDPSWIKNHTMDIPAGDPDVEHSYALGAGLVASFLTQGAISESQPFTIYSSLLHMHLHGTQATLAIDHSDGSNTCLLQIPKWNFHWQGSYYLTQPVQVQPNDQISIDCHWNNSAADQPVINGETIPPADVNWGEGTTDEMCLGFVYVTQ